jgi:hypothetical protein
LEFGHGVGMEKSRNSDEALFRRKRRRWPRAVWVKEVKAFRDSGLSADEYAVQRGVNILTFKRWVRLLGNVTDTDQRSTLPAFVPVRVVSASERPSSGSPFQVEIDLTNGRRLRARVAEDADVRRLADLLDALDGGARC